MATLIHHRREDLGDSLRLSGNTGLGARLRFWLASFKAWRKDARNQALILSQLAAADDRELRDLNIHRYDFEAIAKGQFRR